MPSDSNNVGMGWNLDNSYLKLPQVFFTRMKPVPVSLPKLIIFNDSLAKYLGLNIDELQSDKGAEIFSGNKIPQGSVPLAQAYAGHQFGYFTLLGDGRALLLGEQITPQGERVDIQLKGSGRTPYSRGGDGRASLGPMLREYIISEAMHALGIPTTRSLAVVTTGESIIRETYLPGAILTRVGRSHLRVGTFEYAKKWGTFEDLQILADYTIGRHFPHIDKNKEKYFLLFEEIIRMQAILVAKWQLVGFIHGVMNTDNMSISGETIDYGPCAFMNTYDPKTVFSSIDHYGRYAYANQPPIAKWNLTVLGQSLLPLLHKDKDEAEKMAQDAISTFDDIYNRNWLNGMRAKLGLLNEETDDRVLIDKLLNIMLRYGGDYTNTFLALTFDKLDEESIFKNQEFIHWHREWQARLGRQEASKERYHQLMRNSNPAVIPRNHQVEEALKAAVEDGDYGTLRNLLRALSEPYAHRPEQAYYSTLPSPSNQPYRTFCGT